MNFTIIVDIYKSRKNMRILILCSLLIVIIAGCSGEISTYEEDVQAARKYLNEKKYKSAIIEAKNAIRKKPNEAESRLLLAEIYLNVQNGLAAEKELKKAKEYGADAGHVQIMLMKAYLYMNKISELLKIQESSIRNDTHDLSHFHVYRALAWASKNQFDKARIELTKAKDLNGEFFEYNIAKANIALAMGDIPQAEGAIEGISGSDKNRPEVMLIRAKIDVSHDNIDSAITLLNKIVSSSQPEIFLTPVNYSAYLLLIKLYIEQEKYKQAETILARLRTQLPKSNIPDYLQGLVYYRQKDYQSAKEYLQASEAKNPKHMETLMLLGAVDYSLGFYNQAESYLNRYLTIHPGNIEVRRLLAITQLKLKQPEKAFENFNQIIEMSPDDQNILAVMGETAIRLGKTDIGRSYLKQAIKSGADKNQINLSLAKSYMMEGDDDAAIKLLLENSKDEENAHRTKLLLFGAYVKAQKYDKAGKIVHEIVQDDPDSPASYYLLGYYYSLTGDTNKAEQQYKKSLSISDSYIPALINLGKIYIQRKNYQAAKENIEKVIDINNQNVQAMLMLAFIEEKLGSKKKSIDWLKRSIKTKPDILLPRIALIRYYLSTADMYSATRLASETAELFPDNNIAIEMLAEAHLANHDIKAAYSAIQRAVRLNPSVPRNYVRMGQIEANMGDYAGAKEKFNQALKLRDGYLPAIESLARVEMLLKNEKEAFKWVEKLKTENPKSTLGYELAGNLYLIKKDYDKAEKEFLKALSLSKKSAIFAKYMSTLLFNNKKEKAISVAEDWLKTYPDDGGVRIKLALLLHSGNDCKNAIPHYEFLNTRNDSNVIVLNNLALCYLAMNNKKALDYAREVYELAPENHAVNDTYGWVLVKNGKVNDGLKYLDVAIKTVPANLEYKYHKAVALYRLNRTEEARMLLRDILDAGSEFDEIEEAKKLYQKM